MLTGFLGSGKTTLLSRLLADPVTENTAVLVNEVGEVALDHHLLERTDERTVLVAGGCVCCTERGDLVEALLGLLSGGRGDGPPSRVVIETSGLADPSPILFTIVNHPVLRHQYAVERVISTVDAVNGALHLNDNPESLRQVAAADTLVITKTDLATPETTEALARCLRNLNPSANVLLAPPRTPDAATLLGSAPAGRMPPPETPPEPAHGAGTVRTASLTFGEPLDWTAFGVWLSMLLHARGEDVLRVKGFLNTGDPGPVLLNGVQHVIHPPQHLDAWPDEDRRSRMVFVARGVEPEGLRRSLLAFQKLAGPRAARTAQGFEELVGSGGSGTSGS